MKTLFLLSSLGLIAACAAPSKPPPLSAVVIDGCTVDLQMPVCEQSAPRPYFDVGENASDLAVEYENVKRDLIKAEGCIEAKDEAVSNWRQACIREGYNVR
jgi:hypothetical protein